MGAWFKFLGICIFKIVKLTFSTFLILLLFVSIQPCGAQGVDGSLGWDLSYKLILEQNKLNDIPWIKRWFETYDKSPIKSWIEQQKRDPIVSAVLIEHPNFHAAERTTLFLFRTKSKTFYWESVQVDYHRERSQSALKRKRLSWRSLISS